MEYSVLERKNVIRAAEEDMQIPVCYQMLGVSFLKNNIKVKNIKLPAVRVVGAEAFFNCTALRHAELPRVYVIRKSAFGNCSNLREILLPKTMRELGKGVFDGCKRLEKALFDPMGNCRVLPTMTFANCRALSNIILPEVMWTIGDQAFYKCESLEKIKFPEKLHRIENQAFYQYFRHDLPYEAKCSRAGKYLHFVYRCIAYGSLYHFFDGWNGGYYTFPVSESVCFIYRR